MVDAVTNNRNLVTPLVGGDSGTWGGILNSGVMAQLDLILGNTQAITITASDVTLSIPQWNNCAFNLTGALTGDHSLILPFNANSSTVAVGGLFVVENNTTGAHNVTVKTQASGSTGVIAPQGFRTYLFSDTVNVWYADDAAAHIIPWSGNPNGFVAGTAGTLANPPSVVWDYANNVLYFCTTTGNAAAAVWAVPNFTIPRGFDTAINLQIVGTHTGGNLLSVAVKAANTGIDPTSTNPVTVNFQTVSGSNTTGAPVTANITSALSMTTNATGASLGSANATPFRIWLALFNNAGTAVLAMRNCSTANAVFPLAEYGVASTTSISGSATSAGVWYTPNGTTLTNCAFRIIGYVEYTSGLTTAGTYTADPNNTVLFGTGVKKPGDSIQRIHGALDGNATTANSTTKVQTTTLVAITPTSTINPIQTHASGTLFGGAGASSAGAVQISRGASPTLIGTVAVTGTAGSVTGASLDAYDAPATTSPTTYYVYIWMPTGSGPAQWSGSVNSAATQSQIYAEEIMG